MSAPATMKHRILFTATICAGSFLLFLVQPMIARMALPRLGGAPSVWNSAMLVYQSLLLIGYAYAHWLGKFAPRRQAAIHLAAFLLAAVMLPIGLIAANPPADGSPYFWVPWLLLSSIGPLFFVVSAQAPLIQRWFTLSGGGDPYPLYAASNLGSFAGLLSYPLIVEPLMSVSHQSWLWTIGYAVLAVLVLICSLTLSKSSEAAESSQGKATPEPSARTTAYWIVLAAIPSGLMLSTTLHLTTDIVAMPLIWVIPLGLYLLSFSVAFAAKRWLASALIRVAPLALIFAGFLTFQAGGNWPFLMAGLLLLAIFIISVALHAMMFETRPAPDHLTRFYLAMSVGGVLGGLFCALLAPLIFDWTYEHPLLLLAAAALLGDSLRPRWTGFMRSVAVTRWALVTAIFISLAGFGVFGSLPGVSTLWVCGGILILLSLAAIGNRWLFTGALAAMMLCFNGWNMLSLSQHAGQMTRSYFGIYSIGSDPGKTVSLVHGTTVHGVQLSSAGNELSPTTYYTKKSGVGMALLAAQQLFGGKARISVVGLGAGTLACYARPGQSWRFYEIDPAIVEIARDTGQFTFLERCTPKATMGVGDARLVIAGEPANSADLLVIDAFSSDSVPMHMLTREAFALYQQHISDKGLLLVHISNRYLNLRPVLAAAASDGWTARIRLHKVSDADRANSASTSMWVAMARQPETIRKLELASEKGAWETLTPKQGFSAWTDAHSSILPLLAD